MVKKMGVNFRVEVEHIEKLKKIAREISYKKDRDISYVDLIRKAYEKEYKLEVGKNE